MIYLACSGYKIDSDSQKNYAFSFIPLGSKQAHFKQVLTNISKSSGEISYRC